MLSVWCAIAWLPFANGGPVPVEFPASEVVVSPPSDADLRTGFARVITSADFASQVATPADIIAGSPSVALRHSGTLGNFTATSLRGFWGDNVGIVVDDIPVSGAALGPVDLSLIPTGDIDRIEIYRGVGPYAAGAPLGGIIRIYRKKPTDGAWQHQFQMSAGSFSTLKGLATSNGKLGSTSFSASLGAATTAGDFSFYNDRGTYATLSDDRYESRSNNAFRQGYARLAASTPLHLGASAGTFDSMITGRIQKQGVAGPGLTPTAKAAAREWDGMGRLAWRDVAYGRHLTFSLAADALASERNFLDPLREVGLTVGDARARLQRGGAEASAVWLWDLRNESEIGVRLSHETFRQEGRSTILGAQRLRHNEGKAAATLEHRREIVPNVRLVAGARAERIAAESTMRVVEQTRESAVSPRVGMVTLDAPCQLRANLAAFHRFPSSVERFGDGSMTMANAGLTSEQGRSADVGTRCVFETQGLRVTPDLSLYTTDATGMIVLLPTSQFFLRADNVGKVKLWGLEAHSSVRGSWAGVDAAYTLTSSRDASGVLGFTGKPVVGVPTHHATVSVWVGPERLRLRYDGTYSSKIPLNRANIQPAPGRALHNATLSGTYAPWHLQAELSIQNILNTTHQSVDVGDLHHTQGVAAVRDFVGYPLPGRSSFLSFTWRSS